MGVVAHVANFQFYCNMTSEEKRVYLLLKAVIFHYHGLDREEEADLEAAAARMDGSEELKWAMDFIEKDQITSFERARAFLNDIIGDYTKEKRILFSNISKHNHQYYHQSEGSNSSSLFSFSFISP